MATATVNLDTTQYVRVNAGLNQFIIQAHNDQVRIVFSDTKPIRGNTAFHTLSGGDDKLTVNSTDVNIWALAMSPKSSLTVTENTAPITDSFLIEVGKGNVPGHSAIHKFGYTNADTTPVPITTSQTFQTPTTAIQLEVLSNSIEDSTTGIGARKIRIEILDSSWLPVTIDVDMNGTTPVTIPTNAIRLNRFYVIESGTYATQSLSSHIGTLTIREVATPSNIWGVIAPSPIAFGQSEIGVYTIPAGYRAYILNKNVYADTGKNVSAYFFQRPLADDVSAPYTGVLKIIQRELGISGQSVTTHDSPRGPYIGPCDIGFIGHATSTTADISVEFELLLVQDGF